MSLTKVNFGDKITSALFNAQTYYVFKGVLGYEDTITLADNVAGTLLLKPNVAPAQSTTQLFEVQQVGGNVVFGIDYNGNVTSAGGTYNSLTVGSFVVSGNASLASIVTGSLTAANATINSLVVGSFVVTANASIASMVVGSLSGLAASFTSLVAGSFISSQQASMNTLLVSGGASFAGITQISASTNITPQLTVQNLVVTGVATLASAQVSAGLGQVLIQKISPVSTGSVNFSGIPNTYSHLRLVYQVSGSHNINTTLNLRFNGDTSGTYDTNTWAPVSPSSAPTTLGSQAFLDTVPGVNAGTSNESDAGTLTIPNYAGPFWKNGTNFSFVGQSTPPANLLALTGFQWRSTAAITSIQLYLNSASVFFANGTVFSLYGET